MKIRFGFVSNSSSSSYVLLLPKNFDTNMFIDNMDEERIKEIIEDHDLEDKDELKYHVEKLIEDGYLYAYDDSKSLYVCEDVLRDFKIMSIQGGPDDGSISLMSEREKEKIKELLFKEIRYDKLKKIDDENKNI